MASILFVPDSEHPVLQRLGVEFDLQTRTLGCGGRSRHLAPREAAVLAAFLRAEPGSVISRERLLDAVWGQGDVCEDALTVIVSRLRRHFDRLGVVEPVIETVPRRGYRLGRCAGLRGELREARRLDRSGRFLGVAALALSTLALGIACMALLLAAR